MSDFGENISTLRASMGLSRAAIAEALGVKPDKVKHIETGFQRADHEFVAVLRKKFGVDLNTIFDDAPAAGEHTTTDASSAIFSKYVQIPRYSVQASAGHGALVHDEDGSGSYAFNRKFLDRRGLKQDRLAVISVKGDSMEPELYDGDLILLDMAETVPRDSRIYAVRYNADLFVKRVMELPGNRIQLLSTNANYPPITVDAADLGGIQIIGRVVNSTHEW